MVRLLRFLGEHATICLVVSVFIGMFVPVLAGIFRPLLPIFIVLPLTLALMRIDWAELGAYLKRWPLILILCFWMLVASPVLVWAVLLNSDVAPGVVSGIVLMAAAPPIVSAAAIALFVGLDGAIIVVSTVAAMWLVPLVLPPMALELLNLELDLSLLEFSLRLGIVVTIAFSAAWIGRRVLGPERLARNSSILDGLAVISLFMFVVGVFDGVWEMTVANPWHVIGATALSFVFNIGLQVVSAALFWRLGRRVALSIGLMSGNCNMGLVLITLADRAEPDVIMYFAVAQIPMYVLPALLTPIYRRLGQAS